MNALERLKAKIAGRPAASFVSFDGPPGTHISKARSEASVGFVGGSGTPVFEREGPDEAFVSFDGERGRGISALKAFSISENPLHHHPTKLTEAGGSVFENPLSTSPTKPTYRDEAQTDTDRCWVCTRVEMPSDAFVAILSEVPGEHYWMHSGCWQTHVDRCRAARTRAAS